MGFLEDLFHFGQRQGTEDDLDPSAFESCPQGKNPVITLFFDSEQEVTIAVLSKRTESLDVYFQCRVAQGTAFQKSLFYYELEGYIRENLAKLGRHEGFFPETIRIALGAMQASDKSQKRKLVADRQRRLAQFHGGQSSTGLDPEFLERVLEIARLHRLADDLDVLSVYFMRQTNKTFGKVAARIARDKMMRAKVHVTPFVDGVLISGYSTFTREPDAEVVRVSESGHIVEYQQCPGIELQQTDRSGIYTPANFEDARFSWKCEEIALANLHRWWGDIVMRDYVGHKLVLTWTVDPQSADSLKFKTTSVKLASLRMEASPRKGANSFRTPQVAIKIDVLGSSNFEYDVTFAYEGASRLHEVDLTFLSLVKVSARAVLADLEHCNKRQRERPLLDQEIEYFKLVRNASSL